MSSIFLRQLLPFPSIFFSIFYIENLGQGYGG